MAMTPCVAKFSVIMFGLIRRLLVQPWVYCITRVRHFLALPLRLSFTPALRPPLDLRPSSDKQHKQQKDDFIESIDKEAICRLASKQKGGLPCHVQSWSNGSFNVCFVVAFSDGCTRVVRVPLEPVVYDVWDKVCSEVSTMLYIQDRTTIPIPRVYAYGRCRLKHDDSSLQAFIIMDYIDGNPLDKAILHKAPTEARRRLLGEIVDVFAQLRGLEFSQGGSLTGIDDTTTSWSRLRRTFMPAREECFIPKATTNASFEPRIVGAFSIRKNELQIDGYTAPRFTATTAKGIF
ncbi:hypothetical protein H9Q74_014406 [Fusarium xylarioides]|nr:hypothetical protein H9Q71_013338 [Fusarium xylarioides]KAG5808466.1 hypothetical protein H9Q74_014406 [Fusarium xylarioides]